MKLSKKLPPIYARCSLKALSDFKAMHSENEAPSYAGNASGAYLSQPELLYTG
jgi:hypothetical protein